jgi:hypothetical protein
MPCIIKLRASATETRVPSGQADETAERLGGWLVIREVAEYGVALAAMSR